MLRRLYTTEDKMKRDQVSMYFVELGKLTAEERRWIDNEAEVRLDGRSLSYKQFDDIVAAILAEAKAKFKWHSVPERARIDDVAPLYITITDRDDA